MVRKFKPRRHRSWTLVEHVSPTPPPEPARSPTSRRSSPLPQARERPRRAITPLISFSSPSPSLLEPLHENWFVLPDSEAGLGEEDANEVLDRSIPLSRFGTKKSQRMAKKTERTTPSAVSESDDGSPCGGDGGNGGDGRNGADGGNGGGNTGDHVARVIKSRIRLVVALWLILGALIGWALMMRSRYQI